MKIKIFSIRSDSSAEGRACMYIAVADTFCIGSCCASFRDCRPEYHNCFILAWNAYYSIALLFFSTGELRAKTLINFF